VDEVKGGKSEVQLFNRDIERSSGSALAERNEESAQFSDSDGLEDVVSSESRDKDGEGVESKIEEPVVYNAIVDVAANRFSTFSIDVDTASFAMVRRALLSGKVPSAGSARVEEFVNAFDQDYRPPEKRTFAVYTDRARSPFRAGVELMRIGVRGKVLGRDQQKASVLTLVVDTSGSMNTPDRIGLIKQGIRMLVSGLGPQDQLAIVTFGAKASLALDMTPATDKKAILAAVDGMETQGATHLEGGIRLGYEMASRHFGSGCLNRVVLMSDGVANLGAATADEILKQVEVYRKQGVFCSVYGFGQGTYNDAMLGALADKGDGVYRFIDSTAEAKRAFTEDLSAAFQVIARDVKIQVEFDPRRVKSYRQLGYEKRQLTAEQFRDDRVDAGEVGSGQSATALYDVEVTGNPDEPLGTVRIRWRDENSGQVEELAEPIRASDRYSDFGVAPTRFRLTAGAAELAGVLRGDPISKVTALGDIAVVLRPVGMELSLDRQVQDLVKMVTAARRLMK
jgi:Ca-activated chloride channel family protein